MRRSVTQARWHTLFWRINPPSEFPDFADNGLLPKFEIEEAFLFYCLEWNATETVLSSTIHFSCSHVKCDAHCFSPSRLQQFYLGKPRSKLHASWSVRSAAGLLQHVYPLKRWKQVQYFGLRWEALVQTVTFYLLETDWSSSLNSVRFCSYSVRLFQSSFWIFSAKTS